ncbi:MAG TPA: PP2C family protein-serine/threonine phosphatase [Candidatus Polarisedimenticolia bacterium]|jgi:hypothetical protein
MTKDKGAGTGARPDPSLREVVLRDMRQTGIPGRFARELEDLYHFYLDEERRDRLASMGWLKRGVLFYGWLFRSLLMKLTPARRLALLAALLLVLLRRMHLSLPGLDLVLYVWVLGVALLIIVLMLELKDKLLARDEIEIARQVQLALLPRRHPRPDGWSVWSYTRPANDVGGDLVDYLEMEGRLGIAIGDVAGKGLGAALLMAKLQATLRAVAPEIPSLEALGDRLNTILLRDGLENRYATLFYLEIAPESGRLRYLNAGHNPPFALRASGIETMDAASPPVGMLGSARFVEQSLELAPGEMLVAYSDGVTEARDARDQELGAERLRGIAAGLQGLSAGEAGARLLAEIERFIGEARLQDDLSLLVVARSAPLITRPS